MMISPFHHRKKLFYHGQITARASTILDTVEREVFLYLADHAIGYDKAISFLLHITWRKYSKRGECHDCQRYYDNQTSDGCPR